MPREVLPYKVVRCRWYEKDGTPLHPFCPNGSRCKFLHPSDKGWPGHEPKPHTLLKPNPRPLITRRRSRDSRSRSPEPRRSSSSPINTYGPRMSAGATLIDQNGHCSPYKDRPGYSDRSNLYSPPSRGFTGREDGFLHENDAYMPKPLTGSNNVIIKSHERGRWGKSPLPVSTANVPRTNGSKEPEGQAHRNGIEPSNQASGLALTARNINIEKPFPSNSLEAAGFLDVVELINQLAQLHLRLLETRKVYNNEVLKIDAFRSLAGKFNIPSDLLAESNLGEIVNVNALGIHEIAIKENTRIRLDNVVTGATSLPSLGPHEFTIGEGGDLVMNPASLAQIKMDQEHTASTIFNDSHDKTVEVAKATLESNTDNSLTTSEGNSKEACHALLGTLDVAIKRKESFEGSMSQDAEEMKELLQSIWKSTIFMGKGDNFPGVDAKRIPSSNTAEMKQDFDDSITFLSTSELETLAKPITEQPINKTITKLRYYEGGLVVNRGTGDMSVDSGDKMVKRMRRVSFDDEFGMEHKERQVVRALEDRILALEKRVTRFSLVEKENTKIKEQLKAQQEALEKIRKMVKRQKRAIEDLAGDYSPNSPTLKALQSLMEELEKDELDEEP